ncbi:hypothetical protein [Kushneria pakistanensis]|uniref:hypothetical protein n=1 Tax=Kushneria pakistanensis TaxID=1508770 RepID=UPI001678A6DA|nr:hypothetical protein [Kushneria pakistanensis]
MTAIVHQYGANSVSFMKIFNPGYRVQESYKIDDARPKRALTLLAVHAISGPWFGMAI